MKKILFIGLFLGFSIMAISNPTKLRAYLSYGTFATPDNKPYLETHLSIMGKSLVYEKNANGKFQASVAVTIIFKQSDTVRDFKKYTILSQELVDTSGINFSIFDQQRFLLPNGLYLMELTLEDVNSIYPPMKASDIWDINISDTLCFSSIQTIESYSKASSDSPLTKSGYELIPHQDNFYPVSDTKLTFYAELYNAIPHFGENSPFVVTSAITNLENGEPFESYFRQKRETAKPVNVIFNEFDISNLPSGNYNLTITVRDKENKIVASQNSFFQRSNPKIRFNIDKLAELEVSNTFVDNIKNIDELREYIRMTFPIAISNEKIFINAQLKEASLRNMQQFFLSFWLKRNPADPETAWKKYFEVVESVNKEFSCQNNKGYETERGRVYLQYGAPNQRVQQTDNPVSMPHEIWHYYNTASQSNVKFVFISRSLATCLFTLVHSTAIGEVINVNWQQQLLRHSPASASKNNDQNLYHRAEDSFGWGESSGEYYNLNK